MNYKYKLNTKDYLNFYNYIGNLTGYIKEIVKINRIAAIIIILVIVAINVLILRKMFTIYIILIFSLLIIALIIDIIFAPKITKHFSDKTFTKEIKTKLVDKLGFQIVLELNEDKIVKRENKTETSYLYNEIEEIIETSELLLIKDKNDNFIIIPKEQLNENDIGGIKAFLKKKTKLETDTKLNI